MSLFQPEWSLSSRALLWCQRCLWYQLVSLEAISLLLEEERDENKTSGFLNADVFNILAKINEKDENHFYQDNLCFNCFDSLLDMVLRMLSSLYDVI